MKRDMILTDNEAENKLMEKCRKVSFEIELELSELFNSLVNSSEYNYLKALKDFTERERQLKDDTPVNKKQIRYFISNLLHHYPQFIFGSAVDKTDLWDKLSDWLDDNTNFDLLTWRAAMISVVKNNAYIPTAAAILKELETVNVEVWRIKNYFTKLEQATNKGDKALIKQIKSAGPINLTKI